jgi:glycosyltransferase involved in cell wall biosynthesis
VSDLSVRTIYYLVSEKGTFDGTGIHRVAKAIFLGLEKIIPSNWRLMPVSEASKGELTYSINFLNEIGKTNIDREKIFELAPCKGDILLSVDLVYDLSDETVDFINSRFKVNGALVFFVLYDLIPIRYPEWFTEKSSDGARNEYLEKFKNWLLCLAKLPDGVLCISKDVQNDYELWVSELRFERNSKQNSAFFHLGSDIQSSNPSKGVTPVFYGLRDKVRSQNSFLIVGTLEPRKSHSLAIDAMEILWERGIESALVIAGRPGKPWRSKSTDILIDRIENHSELGKRLIWLNDISDEALIEVYKESTCLLMPSKAEGFGLPLIEAGRLGLPVISRNIPIFRELCGDGAFYFPNNASPKCVADHISDWLDLYKDSSHPSPEGIVDLSWEESAQQLLVAIQHMADDNNLFGFNKE